MSGGYCAMSEHDDRFEELNGAIDSAIERLQELASIHDGSSHLTMGVDEFRQELRSVIESLQEVR